MAPGQRTGIATMDADLARCSANVSSWHETDMPKYLGDVRCWVNSGKHLLSSSFSGFDPTETLVQSNDSALHAGFRPSEAIVLAARMPSP